MRPLPRSAVVVPWCALAVPLWAHQPEEQKLLPSDGQAGDQIGWAVAIDDQTILVGAPGHDASGSDSGAVFVFVYDGTLWVEQQELVPDDPSAGDRFGSAVGVSGDLAVVGAPNADPNGTDSGAIYVFVRSGTTWTQQAKVVGAGVAGGDLFGTSVSISGDTLVAGAPDPPGSAGSAYVFVQGGTSWSQQAKLTASNSSASNAFGGSVFVDGDHLIVGAQGGNGLVAGSGAAYVFLRSGSAWSQEAKLQAADGAAGDLFGCSVSMFNQGLVAIGAVGDDLPLGPDAGSAYVFARTGSAWAQTHKYKGIEARNDFGKSVSCSYRSTLVGVARDDEEGSNAGSTFIYADFGTYVGFENFITNDPDADDYLGTSVAAGSCWIVSGAIGDDELGLDAGAAYGHVVSYPFALVRNGSGVNPLCYATTVVPLIGSTWKMEVDATAFPSAAFTQVLSYRALLATPVLTQWGEGLVNRRSGLIFNSLVPGGGIGTHTFPIPNDPFITGITVYNQGLVLGPSLNILQLCNAEEVRVGCHPAPPGGVPTSRGSRDF